MKPRLIVRVSYSRCHRVLNDSSPYSHFLRLFFFFLFSKAPPSLPQFKTIQRRSSSVSVSNPTSHLHCHDTFEVDARSFGQGVSSPSQFRPKMLAGFFGVGGGSLRRIPLTYLGTVTCLGGMLYFSSVLAASHE